MEVTKESYFSESAREGRVGAGNGSVREAKVGVKGELGLRALRQKAVGRS